MDLFDRFRRRGDPPGPPPTEPAGPGPSDDGLYPLLEQLFRSHGVETGVRGDHLYFPDSGRRAAAAIVRDSDWHPSVLQLDFRLEIGPDRWLIESFAGIGDTRERAMRNAVALLAANTLHVLVRAFLASGDDDQVSVERWTVGGSPRTAVVGPATGRSMAGRAPELPGDRFERVEARIRASALAGGPHWIRIYFAQSNRTPSQFEALLDNEPWPEMVSTLRSVAWPLVEDFYSVRLFLVLLDENE
jgi:hypothetical protein